MNNKTYINADTGTTRSKEQIKLGLFPSRSSSFSWLLIYDPLLESWIEPLEKAITDIAKDTSRSRTDFIYKTINLLIKNIEALGLSKKCSESFSTKNKIDFDLFIKLELDNKKPIQTYTAMRLILEKIIKNEYSTFNKNEVKVFSNIKNPMIPIPINKQNGCSVITNQFWDKDFKWLTDLDTELESLREMLVRQWPKICQEKNYSKNTQASLQPVLRWFFSNLDKLNLPKYIRDILLSSRNLDFFEFSALIPTQTNLSASFQLIHTIFMSEIIDNYSYIDNGKLRAHKEHDSPLNITNIIQPKTEKSMLWIRDISTKLWKIQEFFEYYIPIVGERFEPHTLLAHLPKINVLVKKLSELDLPSSPEKIIISEKKIHLDDFSKIYGFSNISQSWDFICDIFDEYIRTEHSHLNENQYRIPNKGFSNPFVRTKILFKPNITYSNLLKYNENYINWIPILTEFTTTYYLNQDNTFGKGKASIHWERQVISCLHMFFCILMPTFNINSEIKSLLFSSELEESYTKFAESEKYSVEYQKKHRSIIHDLFYFILRKRPEFIGMTLEETWDIEPNFKRNSTRMKGIKRYGFKFISLINPNMNDWVNFAENYIADKRTEKLDGLKNNLIPFLEYLLKYNIINPIEYITRTSFDSDFLSFLNFKHSNLAEYSKKDRVFEAYKFIEYLRLTLFENDPDSPETVYGFNPLKKIYNDFLSIRDPVLSESNKVAMPAWLVQKIKNLYFPLDSEYFSEWINCHLALEKDFVEVPENLIDKNDPDCVWRSRNIQQRGQIFEIWNPVTAILFFLLLHTPLRNIQIRALDSGEFDTFTFNINKSKSWFSKNNNPLITHHTKKPICRGVFHISDINKLDQDCNSLFINTNKTADIDKAANNKGYVMPLLNAHHILFWLHKLRTWQQKYNPITKATQWESITNSIYFGTLNPKVVRHRNPVAFLFRSVANNPNESHLPIPAGNCPNRWLDFLLYAELYFKNNNLLGEDNDLIILTKNSETNENKKNPVYTQHGMRVTMISFLVLDLGIPLEIVSKMIAGHSSIIMTLHYTKLNTAYVRDILDEAERKVLDAQQQNSLRSLKQKTIDSLSSEFASLDVVNALSLAKGCNELGYIVTEVGICPNGASLCHIGGECLTPDRNKNIEWASVSGYPKKNCIRCRFNLSSLAFINGLKFQFDQAVYNINELQTEIAKVYSEINLLESIEYQSSINSLPFSEVNKLRRSREREVEISAQLSENISNMQAAHHLIQTLIKLNSDSSSNNHQLVTIGNIGDLHTSIHETSSKLYSLSIICQQAEIYHTDDAGKYAIKQAQAIDCMLDMNGLKPIMYRIPTELQLAAGNSLIKLMQSHMPNDTIIEIMPFLECERKLEEIGLLQPFKEKIEKMSIQLTAPSTFSQDFKLK